MGPPAKCSQVCLEVTMLPPPPHPTFRSSDRRSSSFCQFLFKQVRLMNLNLFELKKKKNTHSYKQEAPQTGGGVGDGVEEEDGG